MAKEGKGKGPDWLTKQEAANLIGVSIRSVERLVEHGDIKQKFMKVVGRRPIAVLNPVDVEKAKRETLEKQLAEAAKWLSQSPLRHRQPRDDKFFPLLADAFSDRRDIACRRDKLIYFH
jgi:hypothetical protein